MLTDRDILKVEGLRDPANGGFQKPMCEIGKSAVGCCQFVFCASLFCVQRRTKL